MGEIHELFVLALSLVWFASATPEFYSVLDKSGAWMFLPCSIKNAIAHMFSIRLRLGKKNTLMKKHPCQNSRRLWLFLGSVREFWRKVAGKFRENCWKKFPVPWNATNSRISGTGKGKPAGNLGSTLPGPCPHLPCGEFFEIDSSSLLEFFWIYSSLRSLQARHPKKVSKKSRKEQKNGALRKGPPFHGSRSSWEIKIKIQNASCQMGGREVTRW